MTKGPPSQKRPAASRSRKKKGAGAAGSPRDGGGQGAPRAAPTKGKATAGRGKGGASKKKAASASSRSPARGSTEPRPPRDLAGGKIKNPYLRYRPLKKPPLEPQVTTLWDFPSQHYSPKGADPRVVQGSPAYRGATPSYVIWNFLTAYTQAGQKVLDPFCGSGTTLDVCEDLGREGIGFDISPYREDIQAADARSLPLMDRSVDAAFLDPPYADNLKYSDHPKCIGRTRAQDGSWHEAMGAVFDELARVVRPGGMVAAFVADILHHAKRGTFHPLGVELAAIGRERMVLIEHVAVVRHNRDLERGDHRKAALEEKFMLRGFNHLLIFRVRKTSSERFSSRRPSTAPKRRRTKRR